MLFNLLLLNKVSAKRVFGTARVLAYGMVVTAGLGAFTIRNAVADVHVQSLELGRKLADVQDLVPGAREFRLNGQTVFFSASSTTEPLTTVLDRFEAHCDKSRAFDALEWKSLGDVKGKDLTELKDKDNGTLAQRGVSRFGIVRTEDASVGDGVVMCFTGDNSPKKFLDALEAFGASGDLHELGNVRYVHAATKNGKTDIQAVWTDGSFNVRTIIGTPGQDSVGSDFATLPRPLNSTRLITAEAVGTPYAARIYESSSAPDVVLDTYVTKMLGDGWSSINAPNTKFADGTEGRWFMKPETAEQAVVSVSKNAQKQKTVVVVGSLGVSAKGPKDAPLDSRLP